jgi:hypothetical protein
MDAHQTPMKQPSAWLPVAMSCLALAIVVGHIAMVGTSHEADEGVSAHTWQMLMVLQVPVVAFFAAKWLRREPRLAVRVLALHALAAAAALAPVWYFAL